jgi:hypothetical protein
MITALLASAPAAPAPSADAISVSSAVLLLVTGGLLYCLYALADLRRQLKALAARSRATPAAPAAGPEGHPAVPHSSPAAAATSAAAPAPAAHTASADNATIPSHILAAIAAAVHVTLGGRHRVLSIIPAPPSSAPSWSVEGRREVFSSHHVR